MIAVLPFAAFIPTAGVATTSGRMTDVSPNAGVEIGKATLASVLLVVVVFALLLLIGVGPVGWILLFLLWVAVKFVISSWYGDDDVGGIDRTNCPNCGARIAADSDRCDYCTEPLTVSE